MGGFPFFRNRCDDCGGCGGFFGGFFGGDGCGCGCDRDRDRKVCCITAIRACKFEDEGRRGWWD